jgi:hypothetical protein
MWLRLKRQQNDVSLAKVDEAQAIRFAKESKWENFHVAYQ